MTVNVGGRDMVLGFDWSYWQTPRDLRPAKAAGYEVGIIKVTEGNGYRDPKYGQHCANVLAAGITLGSYHFAQPGGNGYQDGRAEARFALGAIHPDTACLVLDLEATALDAWNTTEYVRGWLDEVDGSGRFPTREQKPIYVGKWFSWFHSVTVAQRGVLWLPSYTAGYTKNVDPRFIPLPAWSADLWPEGWAGWQFSSSGTVAGLHPSDVNVFTVQWHDAVRGGPVTPPAPFPTPERIHMAAPVFSQNGVHFYLAAAPGQPRGAGWVQIPDVATENHLALGGLVEPAFGVAVGTGQGQGGDPNAVDVYDETWESFPVIAGDADKLRPALR